jgi:hypothetical protein
MHSPVLLQSRSRFFLGRRRGKRTVRFTAMEVRNETESGCASIYHREEKNRSQLKLVS